jgi:hypothetical protein
MKLAAAYVVFDVVFNFHEWIVTKFHIMKSLAVTSQCNIFNIYLSTWLGKRLSKRQLPRIYIISFITLKEVVYLNHI